MSLPASILLVDDHQMMREGLRVLLEKQPKLTVVGEADNGRTAIELARELQPEVVVMDVAMPDLNGIEATRRVRNASPLTRVIGLSVHADRRYVVEMFKAGASGYLLKNCASDELVRAIDAVLVGQAFLSPGITSTVVAEAIGESSASTSSAFVVLTAREREVLQLLAEGNTSKDIAARLELAVRTVETHRREITRKLKLRSVAALTKYAIREGLTTLDD